MELHERSQRRDQPGHWRSGHERESRGSSRHGPRSTPLRSRTPTARPRRRPPMVTVRAPPPPAAAPPAEAGPLRSVRRRGHPGRALRLRQERHPSGCGKCAAQQTRPPSRGCLRNTRRRPFLVEGHCDERGTTEYNLALGDRRSTAAMDFLVNLGVPASKLSKVSLGEERPVCSDEDESCYQRNRPRPPEASIAAPAYGMSSGIPHATRPARNAGRVCMRGESRAGESGFRRERNEGLARQFLQRGRKCICAHRAGGSSCRLECSPFLVSAPHC